MYDEDGSHIENKASGRKVRSLVIDVHVKDVIDTRGQVFVGLGERR